MAQAATLAPDDAFFEASRDFLDSVERAPGAPPEALQMKNLALLEGPSAAFFAEGYTLGSGDRGRNVKAVQQRLARIPGLDFVGPGSVFRRLPRTDPECRGGVPVGTGAGAQTAWWTPQPGRRWKRLAKLRRTLTRQLPRREPPGFEVPAPAYRGF